MLTDCFGSNHVHGAAFSVIGGYMYYTKDTLKSNPSLPDNARKNKASISRMKDERLHKPIAPMPVPGDNLQFHHMHARDIRGKMVDFNTFQDKVVLIVNVASHDVKSEAEYKDMEELYRKYRDKGLEIVAFPCNQFGGEEAGSNAEIGQFVKKSKCLYVFCLQNSNINM
jgi:hypothetical protein